MAGNVLIKNANGKTVTLQNPDTNLADVVVDTSKIVGLANFIGTNQSLVSNGYQKLPGGLIIQWGSKLASVANTQYQFTFPTPFSTTVLNFTCSCNNSGTTFTGAQGYVVSNSTYSIMATGASTTVAWFAIGY